jgi:hypothetical protein
MRTTSKPTYLNRRVGRRFGKKDRFAPGVVTDVNILDYDYKRIQIG